MTIEQDKLQSEGFTPSGKTRFTKTVVDYELMLFERALGYANVEKDGDAPVEVTHDHVRAAAHSIAATFGGGRPQKSRWIITQVGEYVATAVASVGASNVKENWGIPTLVFAAVVGIALFVARMTKRS